MDGRGRRDVGLGFDCGGDAGGIVAARCERDNRFSGSSACGRSKLAMELRREEASECGEAVAITDGEGGAAGSGTEDGEDGGGSEGVETEV